LLGVGEAEGDDGDGGIVEGVVGGHCEFVRCEFDP
jgi:hypothetical protein